MDLQKSGRLIAEKRKERNWTQKQLGDQVGVSDKAVSKWERGLSFPDIAIVEKLAQTLDLSLSELLGGEEKEEVPAQTETLLSDMLLLFLREFARRRKRQIIRTVLVLAILIPLIAMWAFIVQPVDGTGKTDKVQAQAFPSGNVLSLPIKTRVNPGDFYAFGDMYFKTDMVKNEIEENLIAWFGEENVTDLNGRLLVEQTDEQGRTDFYMLALSGFYDGKKSYIWTGMRMGLGQGTDGESHIVIPLHLFDDRRISLRDSVQLVCGTEYEVCERLSNYDVIPTKTEAVTPQMFKDFYEQCGWFDVSLDDNILRILPKADCAMQNGFTLTFVTHAENSFCIFDWIEK